MEIIEAIWFPLRFEVRKFPENFLPGENADRVEKNPLKSQENFIIFTEGGNIKYFQWCIGVSGVGIMENAKFHYFH